VPEPSQKAGPATLARLIAPHASSAGGRSGLVHADRTWSYADLATCAVRWPLRWAPTGWPASG